MPNQINEAIACFDCGDSIPLSEVFFDNDNECYYCPRCWEGRSSHFQEFSVTRLDLSKNTFKQLRYKKCFGVELEVDDKNLPYTEIREQTKFGSKHDGSLNCGSEFYSPILQGDKGYQQIKTICKLLKNKTITYKTGYHLHIDARDMKWQTVKKLWMLYNIFEGVLYAMLPESRQDNRYCKKSQILLPLIASICDFDDLKALWYQQGEGEDNNDENNYYNPTRYFGFNLHSYFYRSTIEIRYHSGTVNFDKIINWIKINQSLFEYALNHNEKQIVALTNFENYQTNYSIIRKLFKSVISNKSLWKYYKQRFNLFNSQKEYGWYRLERKMETCGII